MANAHRRIGDCDAVSSGSQMAATLATTARSITLDVNQVVVLWVVPPSTTPQSVKHRRRQQSETDSEDAYKHKIHLSSMVTLHRGVSSPQLRPTWVHLFYELC